MVLLKKIFSFMVLLFSISFGCFAEAEMEAEDDSLNKIFFRGFDDDSYFVTIPTYAGNYLGLIIGAVPAACVAGGFQFADESPATVKKSAKVTLSIFSKTLGMLMGLPFKFTKMLLWDSPKYIYGGIVGDTDPPVELPEDKFNNNDKVYN